jgi:hypothetical protein
MSETPERTILSAAESQALVTLSRGFLSAVRNWALYPAEHPTVRAAIERFRDAIAQALEAKVTSAISVTPTSLLVRGIPAPDDVAIAETAALLHAHGILEIGFDPVVPAEAPARLLAFLGRPSVSFQEQGGVSEAWAQHGHPAIRIEAVDYRKVLEDHDAEKAVPRRDDVWRAIVSALASGRRTLDEREQERLLELADDPGELAALADTLIAEKCTPQGSPMVTTQAATVLASFRHLGSIASVLAPDRAQAILKNLATALLQMDPHVSMQLLFLEGQRSRADEPRLATALSEEGVAQLLATVLALEGQASPCVAQMFELLVPDLGRRRGVLERARMLARGRHTGDQPFDAFWDSIEELLLSYNDQAFVTSEYRAVLDGSGAGSGTGDQASAPPVAELTEWITTVSEDHLRQLSIILFADLLRLETHTDRAIAALNQLADLADDLLIAGMYEDTMHVLEAIREAAAREDLMTPSAQALQRIGTSEGVREAAAMIADLGETEWSLLARCYRAIGASCLDALGALLLSGDDNLAAERAGDVFVAIGEDAIQPLVRLLDESPTTVRPRVAALLGRIASPAAVPALQAMLRAHDSRVIQAAVRALAGIDDPAATRAIHLALRASDGRAREMVVDALVAVADRRVVPMLVRVLESSRPLGSDYQVALHALDALARLRDGRAVCAVAAVMFLRRSLLRSCFSRRKVRTLKRAAVRTLLETGDAAALQALDRAGRTGDRMLRGIVREMHVHAVEGAA